MTSLVVVIVCQGILLYFCTQHTSLMAHDEGWYTTLALGMVRQQDWLSPTWWGQLIYDKTSGVHWLIATSLSIFGQSEVAARLPSGIACVMSTGLVYCIGSHLIGQRAALVGAVCLSSVFLWTQYGQLATQDMPLVCAELICIWALLAAESLPKYRHFLGFLAGLFFGIGFLVKGFMVALPSLALLPYLVVENHRHKHLFNLGIYGGLIGGISIVLLWFWQLWNIHGSVPFQQLFGTLFLAASEDYHGVGPFYYAWNIPAAFIPWTPLVVWGVVNILKTENLQRKWLLLGYPCCLLILLQVFPTKTLYYPLQIYPFLALYAGLGIHQCLISRDKRRFKQVGGFYGSLGLILTALVLILGVISVLKETPFGISDQKAFFTYLAMASIIGGSWLGLGWMSNLTSKRRYYELSDRNQRRWLVSLLAGPCCAIAIAGTSGMIGDYNADIKAFCQQPEIATILNQYSVDSVISNPSREDHKIWILTSYFTQEWGEHFLDVSDFPVGHYGWIGPEFSQIISPQQYTKIGEIRGWSLVQRLD